jgi:hypothetical protein
LDGQGWQTASKNTNDSLQFGLKEAFKVGITATGGD